MEMYTNNTTTPLSMLYDGIKSEKLLIFLIGMKI
jgi:hypothetical protein